MLTLATPRMTLVASSESLLAAELDGPVELGRLLHARVADGWPPPLMAGAASNWLAAHRANPALEGWLAWYWVLGSGKNDVLVGSGGFGGRPGATGRVQLGYAVLEPWQRMGLATEAVGALLAWVYAQPGVEQVVADTFPGLGASIAVLERNGFRRAGDGEEPGSIRYRRNRGDPLP